MPKCLLSSSLEGWVSRLDKEMSKMCLWSTDRCRDANWNTVLSFFVFRVLRRVDLLKSPCFSIFRLLDLHTICLKREILKFVPKMFTRFINHTRIRPASHLKAYIYGPICYFNFYWQLYDRQLGWEGQISISNNIINIHNSLYDYEA